ncbi:MAG: metallophosphoesterase [Syntrophorhabdaceae bacterium]|nr:metallophosphoesterase [Syntrophorhabdaceae bacterium]MDD5243061.1 metallophosphoesterase [Syntrophorhabdaceae bacterium]
MSSKRIFISDIHMGDKRSANQVPEFQNYCWFYHPDSSPDTDRPEILRRFLEEYCFSDTSVTEVVIVGDFFDEWVCPAQFDPTEPPYPAPLPKGEQYRKIAVATQNLPVIETLRKLASQDRLVYVPGNHDMFADKSVVNEIFPGIRYPDSKDGHYVYRADGIWAEHGHWYGMFNAPHPAGSGSGFAGSHLPLGYFITRINAEEALRTGSMLSLPQVFKEWIEHVFSEVPEAKDPEAKVGGLVDTVLMNLFNTLVSNHAYGQEGAVMNGFDGIPGKIMWEEIKTRYSNIYDAWPDNHPDNVGPLNAILSDAGNLDQATRLVTLRREDVKIVVCGHTHDYRLASYSNSPYPPDEIPPEDNRIYANSGAWTNDTQRCTFVETELRSDDGKHLVYLKEWLRDPSTGQYKARDVQPDEWVVA